MPSFDTARLHLRPWNCDDVDALHALWTNPDVRRWLWDDVVISKDRAEETVVEAIREADESGIGMWCISRQHAPGLIGFCGFRHFGEEKHVELIYGLLPDHWGRGLAAEAAQSILNFGFGAGLFDRVYGRTDVPNRASARVLEKLGMQFDGRMLDGGLELVSYSLLRSARTKPGS